MFLKFVFVALLVKMQSEAQAESIEDMNPFVYSQTNAVNFNDIFSYTSSLVGGDTVVAPDAKEDEYSLHPIPNSQLLDLNKTPPPRYVKSYPPPPKYVQNPKLKNKKNIDIFSETTTEFYTTASYEATSLKRVFPPWMTPPSSSSTSTSTQTAPTSTTTMATTTTQKIDETTTFIMVATTRDPTRERGILDLLFPPKRVKTFKTMFDAFRNILSHTFKR